MVDFGRREDEFCCGFVLVAGRAALPRQQQVGDDRLRMEERTSVFFFASMFEKWMQEYLFIGTVSTEGHQAEQIR